MKAPFVQPERTAKPLANPTRASKPLSDTRKERPSLIRRQVLPDHRPADTLTSYSPDRSHRSSVPRMPPLRIRRIGVGVSAKQVVSDVGSGQTSFGALWRASLILSASGFPVALPNTHRTNASQYRQKATAALMCFGSIERELSNAVKIIASRRTCASVLARREAITPAGVSSIE
jgi:hypothetical protein